MRTIQIMRTERAAALARAEALDVAANGSPLAAADQTAFDAAMGDVDRIDAEIAAEQSRLDLEASTSNRRDRLASARAVPAPRTVPASTVASHAPIVSRERRQDDPRRGFADVGHFASVLARASMPGLVVSSADRDLLAPLAAVQGNNQANGSEGGFLVPAQFSTQIWDGLNNPADSLMALCDQYPIEGDSITFPANAETNRANGSRYGGIQGNWLAEGAQLPKSTPKFRTMKLEPHTLAALVYVTEKLLRSAPTLGVYLQKAATDEINFMVGDAIVNGNGAGKPLGIMNSGALVTVAKEAGQATLTLLQANISKMWARLHPRCRANARWFYNVDVEPMFDGLNTPIRNAANTDNVGGIGNNVYNAEKMTIKGRPIQPIEFCPSLTNLGDIILADMSMYAVGTQGGIDAASSMHLRFDYAEQAFRFMFNVDGQPWLQSALTPYKGANTLSSFVTLQAR